MVTCPVISGFYVRYEYAYNFQQKNLFDAFRRWNNGVKVSEHNDTSGQNFTYYEECRADGQLWTGETVNFNQATCTYIKCEFFEFSKQLT